MIASRNEADRDALYEAVERLQHHPYGNSIRTSTDVVTERYRSPTGHKREKQ